MTWDSSERFGYGVGGGGALTCDCLDCMDYRAKINQSIGEVKENKMDDIYEQGSAEPVITITRANLTELENELVALGDENLRLEQVIEDKNTVLQDLTESLNGSIEYIEDLEYDHQQLVLVVEELTRQLVKKVVD